MAEGQADVPMTRVTAPQAGFRETDSEREICALQNAGCSLFLRKLTVPLLDICILDFLYLELSLLLAYVTYPAE